MAQCHHRSLPPRTKQAPLTTVTRLGTRRDRHADSCVVEVDTGQVVTDMGREVAKIVCDSVRTEILLGKDGILPMKGRPRKEMDCHA